MPSFGKRHAHHRGHRGRAQGEGAPWGLWGLSTGLEGGVQEAGAEGTFAKDAEGQVVKDAWRSRHMSAGKCRHRRDFPPLTRSHLAGAPAPRCVPCR